MPDELRLVRGLEGILRVPNAEEKRQHLEEAREGELAESREKDRRTRELLDEAKSKIVAGLPTAAAPVCSKTALASLARCNRARALQAAEELIQDGIVVRGFGEAFTLATGSQVPGGSRGSSGTAVPGSEVPARLIGGGTAGTENQDDACPF